MTDSIVESDAFLSDDSFEDEFYEDDDYFDQDSTSEIYKVGKKKGIAATESFEDDENYDDGEDDSSGTIDENLIDSDLEDDSPPTFRIISTGLGDSDSHQGFWKDIICWATSASIPSSSTAVGTPNTTRRIPENSWTNSLGADAAAESAPPSQLRAEHHQLSEAEEKRAKTVFDHCANAHARLNEEQFRMALSLLGQIEKDDHVRKVFVKERTEWIDLYTFKRLLVELQANSEISDLSANIQDAFDALYEGTCSEDDQRDEFGRRYIFARDLRQVLTSQGSGGRLTDEEADQLLRETHPVPLLSKDGQMLDAVFFEQFRSMLIDANT